MSTNKSSKSKINKTNINENKKNINKKRKNETKKETDNKKINGNIKNEKVKNADLKNKANNKTSNKNIKEKTKKTNVSKEKNKKQTDSKTNYNKENSTKDTKEIKKDEIKKTNKSATINKDNKKEVENKNDTQIISDENNLKIQDSKIIRNDFTSTIDIKEIIKAIPKKTHKKEEVENAIADIFDIKQDNSNNEKNFKKECDYSTIKKDKTSENIDKKDTYLIDEINNIEPTISSINNQQIDSTLKNEIKVNNKKDYKLWKNLSIFLILILLGTFIFIIYHFKTSKHNVTITENKILDDNYIFLGDSITELYNLDDYYQDFKIVNSGKSGYRTSDILGKLDKMVYEYNPTKIFLLIGTNDFLNKDITTYEIYKNITQIIEEIQKNRKYAKIYVESIYPTCHHDEEKVNLEETNKRPNDKIKEINQKLKEYCTKNNITYIDVYSKLLDDKNELKLDYTVDGLHLTKEGYDVVSKTLMPYVKEKIKY